MRLIKCGFEDLGSRSFGALLLFVGFGGPGGHCNVMAADWIVIPRARSAGKKSVTVDPSSTSVEKSKVRGLF